MYEGERKARLYDARIDWSGVGLNITLRRGDHTALSRLPNLSTRTPAARRRGPPFRSTSASRSAARVPCRRGSWRSSRSQSATVPTTPPRRRAIRKSPDSFSADSRRSTKRRALAIAAVKDLSERTGRKLLLLVDNLDLILDQQLARLVGDGDRLETDRSELARQLEVFESVARNLSYTKASQELHLSQPAVSMQVRQLEEEVGLALFALVVVFQIVTLPVEFDASARAKRLAVQYGIVSSQERVGVDTVLNAAALTYVAAAVASLGQLLYFLVRSGILGGRR